jgi:RNA recognition motif-containing protein
MGNALTIWMSAVPVVALFSLLWFGAGILVGTQLNARKASGRSSGRRSRGGRENQRRSKSSNGSGAVELYVGNLPYATSEKELTAAFAKFGKVRSVRLIESRRDGRPKGFGFVEMEDGSKAEVAIKAMNGKGFNGRSIVVNEARAKDREGSDSGGRRRR